MPLDKALSLLSECYSDHIKDKTFVKLMYDYLEDQIENIQLVRDLLKEMKIIPVKGRVKGTIEFLSWHDCSSQLYVKDSAEVSTDDCWILQTEFLKKEICEKFFNIHINELTSDIEDATYRKKILKEVEHETNSNSLYEFLLNEFKNNNLNLIKCKNDLIAWKNRIPLKNQLGELKKGNMYFSNEDMGYFAGYLIPSHIVHKECVEFAKFIGCEDISKVHYDELQVNKPLTADDIESLQDDGIRNGFEIINRCRKDGYIADDLVVRYQLDVFLPIDGGRYDESIFNQPIKDKERFQEKMNERLRNSIEIRKKLVEREINIGVTRQGTEISLDNNGRRDYIIGKYSPIAGYCVCQMCKKLKKISYIEVNNIEKLPKYYWEECGVVLCLECSKHFEELRARDDIRERFHDKIKEANVNVDAPIEILIGADTITFSQTHLAEIQEILKRQDK